MDEYGAEISSNLERAGTNLQVARELVDKGITMCPPPVHMLITPDSHDEPVPAWLISAAFVTANLLLLHDRIRREEQALQEENGIRESFVGK